MPQLSGFVCAFHQIPSTVSMLCLLKVIVLRRYENKQKKPVFGRIIGNKNASELLGCSIVRLNIPIRSNGGGGQVVRVFVSYSQNPSSNPTKVYHFSVKLYLRRMAMSKMRPGLHVIQTENAVGRKPKNQRTLWSNTAKLSLSSTMAL